MKSPLSHPLTFAVAGLLCLPLGAAEVDTSFRPEIPSGTVHAISPLYDGSLIVGGDFANSLIKIRPTGLMDTTFANQPRSKVFAIAAGPDGLVYVGGSSGVRCVEADGTPHSTFASIAANGWVKALGFQSASGLIVAGSFWSSPGTFLARSSGTGQIDGGFTSALEPNFAMESGVCALTLQPDGKIIVGGSFNVGSTSPGLARLNPDGSVDTSFAGNPGAILYPKVLRSLDDGKILVAGIADSSGRGFLRRLNSNGSVDQSFSEVTLDRSVEALAIDASERLVIGGDFRVVNNQPRVRLARLSGNGTVDSNWNIGANNVVRTLLVEESGRILVGGAFTEIGGVAQRGLARINDETAFRFKPLSVSSGGELHLSLKGEAGKAYVIESSSDLRSWTVFATNTAATEGLSVTSSDNSAPQQFFRARVAE